MAASAADLGAYAGKGRMGPPRSLCRRILLHFLLLRSGGDDLGRPLVAMHFVPLVVGRVVARSSVPSIRENGDGSATVRIEGCKKPVAIQFLRKNVVPAKAALKRKARGRSPAAKSHPQHQRVAAHFLGLERRRSSGKDGTTATDATTNSAVPSWAAADPACLRPYTEHAYTTLRMHRNRITKSDWDDLMNAMAEASVALENPDLDPKLLLRRLREEERANAKDGEEKYVEQTPEYFDDWKSQGYPGGTQSQASSTQFSQGAFGPPRPAFSFVKTSKEPAVVDTAAQDARGEDDKAKKVEKATRFAPTTTTTPAATCVKDASSGNKATATHETEEGAAARIGEGESAVESSSKGRGNADTDGAASDDDNRREAPAPQDVQTNGAAAAGTADGTPRVPSEEKPPTPPETDIATAAVEASIVASMPSTCSRKTLGASNVVKIGASAAATKPTLAVATAAEAEETASSASPSFNTSAMQQDEEAIAGATPTSAETAAVPTSSAVTPSVARAAVAAAEEKQTAARVTPSPHHSAVATKGDNAGSASAESPAPGAEDDAGRHLHSPRVLSYKSGTAEQIDDGTIAAHDKSSFLVGVASLSPRKRPLEEDYRNEEGVTSKKHRPTIKDVPMVVPGPSIKINDGDGKPSRTDDDNASLEEAESAGLFTQAFF